MIELFGKTMTARELAAYSGSLHQFAGVRLQTLADGQERGVRMLEFRSGTGLRFSVLVDRAMDIADCDYRGMSIGWHSPVGTRHPALHEPEGEGGLGWLRSFSGLMVTCGLDHILTQDNAPADHFNYTPRKSVSNAIHGRISAIPARLTGYGKRWDGDNCILWCEGEINQSAVFAENLQLVRRIEIAVGSNEIRIQDKVTNRSFYPTPHMFCYHVNLGYPLLDKGSRYVAPIRNVIWAAHAGAKYQEQGVGYRVLAAPKVGFHEQVWAHETVADPVGKVSVGLINDRLGIGFGITTFKDQFPCMYEWQNLQAGQYTFGMEPSSHHVLGAAFARERNEEIILQHSETKNYETTFSILPDVAATTKFESDIRKVCEQPAEDFPLPTMDFAPLR